MAEHKPSGTRERFVSRARGVRAAINISDYGLLGDTRTAALVDSNGLALDRALRIADHHRTPRRRLCRWGAERQAIAADVASHGFDAERNAYVRAYGRNDLDASVLVLPLLGLHPIDSPPVLGTIGAIRTELSAGGPLLYRYPPGEDGLDGTEGAFLPASFWLAQALAAVGEHVEAVELLADLVPLAGPLGLFAEECDPTSGALLGNYPQALTHAALIQAALAIRDAIKPDPARFRERYRTQCAPAG